MVSEEARGIDQFQPDPLAAHSLHAERLDQRKMAAAGFRHQVKARLRGHPLQVDVEYPRSGERVGWLREVQVDGVIAIRYR